LFWSEGGWGDVAEELQDLVCGIGGGTSDVLLMKTLLIMGVSRQIIEDGLEMKAKIEEILVESGFAESRAAKMDVDDLLK